METLLMGFLLPVCIVVIMPVSIVLIIFLINKAKYNKKLSFFEKCVENGVEINPELMRERGKRVLSTKVTLKTMLMDRLQAGIVCLLLGIGLLVWSISNSIDEIFHLASIIMLAVGIGLIVWYCIGKKMFAKDIKDEEELLVEQDEESK